MTGFVWLLTIGSAWLAALSIAAAAALRGWNSWLGLKRAELGTGDADIQPGTEVAALRARVRRLEAIADGR